MGSSQVLLISMQRGQGAAGLNLTMANHVVLLEPSTNAGVEAQAIGQWGASDKRCDADDAARVAPDRLLLCDWQSPTEPRSPRARPPDCQRIDAPIHHPPNHPPTPSYHHPAVQRYPGCFLCGAPQAVCTASARRRT